MVQQFNTNDIDMANDDNEDGKTYLFKQSIDLFYGDEGDDFTITDNRAHSDQDDQFDTTVGLLQEILLNPQFEQMQKSFFNKHCL